jgi:hypothetical protein
MKGILIAKLRPELVWGRALWGGSAKKWRGTKKTTLEAVPQSFQHVTSMLSFAKSLLESLIMLFKLHSLSIPPFLILSTLKQFEMC